MIMDLAPAFGFSACGFFLGVVVGWMSSEINQK